MFQYIHSCFLYCITYYRILLLFSKNDKSDGTACPDVLCRPTPHDMPAVVAQIIKEHSYNSPISMDEDDSVIASTSKMCCSTPKGKQETPGNMSDSSDWLGDVPHDQPNGYVTCSVHTIRRPSVLF